MVFPRSSPGQPSAQQQQHPQLVKNPTFEGYPSVSIPGPDQFDVSNSAFLCVVSDRYALFQKLWFCSKELGF